MEDIRKKYFSKLFKPELRLALHGLSIMEKLGYIAKTSFSAALVSTQTTWGKFSCLVVSGVQNSLQIF